MIIKLILLIVIWSWKCGNLLRNKLTSLQTLVNRVSSTTLSIFPHWISKLRIRKYQYHSKASSGAGRFSKNLCLCKKSRFIVDNCKSGQHNRQHTFMHHKLQHKTTSNNIPYTGLDVKGRKKGKTKIPSPHRRNQMIHDINLRQDATRLQSTKMKPPFMPFDDQNLCNYSILKDPKYIDCFCINFLCYCVLNQFDLNTDLIDNVFSTKDILQPTKKPKNVGHTNQNRRKQQAKKNHASKTKNSGV